MSPFDEMLRGLEAAFNKKAGQVDIDTLWNVLEEYKSNPDDWSKYAFYEPKMYKRNLVAEYPQYNVMIICWGANSRSTIHDHSGAHCFMKVLEGEIIESRFAWPDIEKENGGQEGEMRQIKESRMSENQILYIHDKVGLHKVTNPSATKSAASLHVYIPPYRKCKAFDQRTGQARDCKISFYSERGRVIGKDEQNPWDPTKHGDLHEAQKL